MDIYLLEKLETGKLRRAVRGLLTRALAEYRGGGICETLALGSTAREISRGCGDDVAEALSLVFIGAAFSQQSEFDRAVAALNLARAVFRRQPSWRQRRNEAIALYGLGLAFQRSAKPSVVDTVSSFQKALDALESIRIHYVVDGDDKNADVADELCSELRARIDAEIFAPILDADFVVADGKIKSAGLARIGEPAGVPSSHRPRAGTPRPPVNGQFSNHNVDGTPAWGSGGGGNR